MTYPPESSWNDPPTAAQITSMNKALMILKRPEVTEATRPATRWQARDAMKELWDEANDAPRVKAALIKNELEKKKMEAGNLIERRGRSCMVDGDRLLLLELVKEELAQHKKDLEKPQVVAVRKKYKKELGFDPFEEGGKDLKYLQKALEVVPVCIGTKPGEVMQEEDYPEGQLGGWKKPLFGKSDEE